MAHSHMSRLFNRSGCWWKHQTYEVRYKQQVQRRINLLHNSSGKDLGKTEEEEKEEGIGWELHLIIYRPTGIDKAMPESACCN